MKLTNLNQEIRTIQGQPIIDIPGTGNLTIKKGFIGCCELHRPQQPAGSGETLKVFAIGIKINTADTECEITNEEKDLLKSVIEINRVYPVAVSGFLLQYLESIKVEKK